MSAGDRTAGSDDRFVISRVFDAPRALVWQAWTVPERIVAWLGPKGVAPGRVIRHALHAGGDFLWAMKMPDGVEMCGKMVYRDITPMSRLVWVNSFADINGVVVRHPMNPTWPMEVLTTVTFADLGDRTEVTLEWVPLNADATERATFRDGKLSMQGGWTGTFDRLEEYLAHT